jgi:hypothetical protein
MPYSITSSARASSDTWERHAERLRGVQADGPFVFPVA